MRLAFVALLDVSREGGVVKKVREQMTRWQLAGHEVRLFAFAPTRTVWSGFGDVPVTVQQKSGFPRRHAQLLALARQVRAFAADLVYLRYDRYYPALEWLARRERCVFEVNTDDVAEYRLELPRAKYLVHRLTRARLLSRAAGFVFVTRELSERFARWPAARVVVSNGLDLERFPHLPAPTNEVPRLAFLGSRAYPWHGADKLLLLARYRPAWRFDVVGYEQTELPGLAPRNLTCHGRLARDDYLRVLGCADVAIGSLALERNDLTEACPLKVREYLACGIPALIGYRDTDFPVAPAFLLELAAREDNVGSSLERIDAFVSRARGERVPRAAVAHLDSRVKEAERLAFFARIADR